MYVVPTLRRFDAFVYKDYDANDKTQVPAAATIDFYAQGATLNEANDFLDIANGAEVTVTVWHPGSLGDPVVDPNIIDGHHRVQIGVESGDVFEVVSVDPAPDPDEASATVTLKNESGHVVSVVRKDARLVRITDRPEAYDDPVGLESTGSNALQTNATTGRARGYLREYRYDYIVTITETSERRLFRDSEGSFVMRTLR